MTNAELIQKIRAEIERHLNSAIEHQNANPDMPKYRWYLYEGAKELCTDLLGYIDDTLEESERPEPYNPVYDEAYLNEKIKKATESWKGVDVDAMLAECRGYDEEKSEKPMQEGLEEEVRRYYFDVATYISRDNPPLSILAEIARHFAEWQKEQDEKEQADLFTIVAIDAAQRAKEQMMKEAVEGEYGYFSSTSKTILPSGKLNLKEGDKIRIIIVKEGEK